MTLLEFFNRVLFQWFFVRLARIMDDSGKQTGWTWLTHVVPGTGWTNDFRYIDRKFFDQTLLIAYCIAMAVIMLIATLAFILSHV
jgi:hypothetical protein